MTTITTSFPNQLRRKLSGDRSITPSLGQDDVEFVSVPNELDGDVRVKSNDDFRALALRLAVASGNTAIRAVPAMVPSSRLLSGYRNYQYDSNLSVTENLLVLPGTTTLLVPGTTFFVQDRFRTENEFNGGEIGVQGVGKHCWWWLDGMAKVAFGEQRRTVTIDGQTFIDVPGGGTASYTGGLLTSELTNIGRYQDSDFVFIPEFRLGGGLRLSRCCSVRAGYNLIIWADVARAALTLAARIGRRSPQYTACE